MSWDQVPPVLVLLAFAGAVVLITTNLSRFDKPNAKDRITASAGADAAADPALIAVLLTTSFDASHNISSACSSDAGHSSHCGH